MKKTLLKWDFPVSKRDSFVISVYKNYTPFTKEEVFDQLLTYQAFSRPDVNFFQDTDDGPIIYYMIVAHTLHDNKILYTSELLKVDII